ncbi:toluene tolerance protein [Coraliomargarita sp. SDUM461004]|uniref:Toluene tolerance protein n=1 Tax=Thalassobacterium sedimentorum TaxID=3041258 RepID=A0ABU1AJZ7_9BACT|nr:hypothetical protein [Coraliomargarita sp. SDUM461004]MDQ8195144.1 toluene tolerance protein [Coraliomargarita sp. SDUM461004]
MRNKKTIAEYARLTQEGTVLENEGTTPKVILLPKNRILKLFRRKHLLSSQIWITHAARFARNAGKLQRRGIPTVTVKSVFSIPEMQRQAVLYHILEGDTLRDWLNKHTAEDGISKCKDLGQFVAGLHRCGILFRSMHFGNIIVRADGTFGLIDIVDTGFKYWGPLSQSQRIRNFHHMDRHDSDRVCLAGPAGAAFLHSYLAAAGITEKAKLNLAAAFKEIFSKYNT